MENATRLSILTAAGVGGRRGRSARPALIS